MIALAYLKLYSCNLKKLVFYSVTDYLISAFFLPRYFLSVLSMNVFFPVSASGCLLNSSQPQGCSGYSSAPFFDTGKNPVHCSFRGRSLAAAPGRIAKKTGRTSVPAQGRGFRPVHKPPSVTQPGYHAPKRRCSSHTFRYGYLVTT